MDNDCRAGAVRDSREGKNLDAKRGRRGDAEWLTELRAGHGKISEGLDRLAKKLDEIEGML